jgi:hypothetical protein
METLIAYHNGQQLVEEEANATVPMAKTVKKKNTKKAKKQIKEEPKEMLEEGKEEILQEEIQEETQEKPKPEIKQNTPPESKKMWADYGDDDKMEFFVATPVVETKAPEKKVPEVKMPEASSISFKHIVEKHATTASKPIFPPLPKESNESTEWMQPVKEKKYFKASAVVKKVKSNLPVAHDLNEFIEFIRDQKKPKVDFVICDDAHCEHTFKGTLCPSIRSCKMIHIQRCTKGNTCMNKVCPFLHKKDMPNKQAEVEFQNSISEYNKIKPDKQVKA